MSHAKHIMRAILLLLVGFIVMELGRRLIIPESFGKYGHFRADDLISQRNRPVRFEESRFKGCESCHEERVKEHQNAKHKNIACMNCHGPITEHISKSKNGDMKKTKDMKIERSWKHCARCHQQLAARAKTLPQINVAKHLQGKGMKAEEDVCINCHNPHNLEM